LETSVPFSTDNHELPPEASTFLDEYADLLQENPFVQLEIRGHTDVRGDVQTNQQLSLHRAEAVKNYLVSRGVDSLRLKTIGMGSQQPLNHCQTSANCPDSLHAKNRRAELKVTGITLELNFLLGSTAPTEQQAKTLKRLAELLKANPVLMVVIEGHTDTSGNSVKNQTISTLRAKTVFDLLASMGVNLFQMSYRGMGSTAPKYKDDRDRRVEFKIVSARQ
jgi:outer membrane protein OmpA-like peptidoglycan-associated protein